MAVGLGLAAGLVASAALAADTIKIGAPFNVTGGLSSLDAPALNGAKLKLKEINDAGGINGKQLELVIYDTKTDPTVIASVASQLVSEKVPVAIGFTDSDSVLALGPIFQQAGIPFVTPGATSPKLPDQIGDMIFLACFGDNVQAAAGADFVKDKLAGKNVYLLRDNAAEYTVLLAKYFQEALEHDGGKIIGNDDYKTGDKTFTAQITKIKASGTKPDVVYVSAMPDEIGLIVKQMRQAGIMPPIVGGDGYDTPLLLQVGGKAANDVYFSTHAYMALEFDARHPEILQGLQGRLWHRPGERLRRARLRHARPRRRRDQAGRLGGPEGGARRDRRHQRLSRHHRHHHLPARRARAGEERVDDRRQGRQALSRRRSHPELDRRALGTQASRRSRRRPSFPRMRGP